MLLGIACIKVQRSPGTSFLISLRTLQIGAKQKIVTKQRGYKKAPPLRR
jgi:hypothetical protein